MCMRHYIHLCLKDSKATGQGPVIRKVDSAIYWTVILLTAAEKHKKQ